MHQQNVRVVSMCELYENVSKIEPHVNGNKIALTGGSGSRLLTAVCPISECQGH